MTFLLTDLLAGSIDKNLVEAIDVTGISADSRSVCAGDAFFALPGTKVHGDVHAAMAVERGAVVLVTDRKPAQHPGISVIVVNDVRAAFAMAAARIMSPGPDVLAAITGTSGKTSVASFVRQIWQYAGLKAASIGTLGIDVGGKVVGGTLTTPDAMTLHKSLAVLKAGGTDHVILEASSHGLDQRRLDGIRFDAVGFTNLSRDHLDYHLDFDLYREAKLRLFRELLKDDGVAVVNTDDPEHMPFMFAALDKGATLLTVGTEGAFIEVASVEQDGLGQRVKGRMVGEPMEFVLPLAGRFQVDNAVMAAALAIQTGVEPEDAIAALSKLKGAKGRMEPVGVHNDAAIFVDYSHKPGALEAALETLRPYASGKLVVVFGCGGDRDKGKRPIMGEVASRMADMVIVTDDNPRTEDAAMIRAEIMASAPGAREIGGREAAIKAAVASLEPGDVLLVAGKGHEDYQIIGEEKIHFSDHDVVKAALKG